MNEDQMYDLMRSKQRTGSKDLTALYETLKAADADTYTLPFLKGDEHLYIRCDMMPPRSIKTVDFLAGAIFHEWRIVAFTRIVDFDGQKETIATPYIHIHKKIK